MNRRKFMQAGIVIGAIGATTPKDLIAQEEKASSNGVLITVQMVYGTAQKYPLRDVGVAIGMAPGNIQSVAHAIEKIGGKIFAGRGALKHQGNFNLSTPTGDTTLVVATLIISEPMLDKFGLEQSNYNGTIKEPRSYTIRAVTNEFAQMVVPKPTSMGVYAMHDAEFKKIISDIISKV